MNPLLLCLTISTCTWAWPTVFVGSAFNLEQLAEPTSFAYTSSHAGFHMHPVGWRSINDEQRTAVLSAFSSGNVTMETDICCAHSEVKYVDDMRRLHPQIKVQFVTNNVDTKFYEEHVDSEAKKEGVVYSNSGDMYSSMNSLYEQHHVKMSSLFTVWNAVNPEVSAWMDDTMWGDTVARSHGVCHDWPGRFGHWPHTDQAWIDRWTFYQHVHQQMRQRFVGKTLMHMFNIGGNTSEVETSIAQTKQMVREIEDANVIPDIWIINNFHGASQLVPESDEQGQPAQTLTGFAYWLLKHIQGDDCHVTLSLSQEQSFGEMTKVTLRNSHPWLDFVPMLVTDGELLGTQFQSDGTHRVGRLWPGDKVVISVRCHGSSDVVIKAYHHPSNAEPNGAVLSARISCFSPEEHV